MRKFAKRLVIFFVRKRLKLKKHEEFRFANQKSNATYWFTTYTVMKRLNNKCFLSSVSLNFLLSEECVIEKVDA